MLLLQNPNHLRSVPQSGLHSPRTAFLNLARSVSSAILRANTPPHAGAGQSISKVRAVSLSTVMRTVITLSGSSCSIFSGHSTRHRSPE